MRGNGFLHGLGNGQEVLEARASGCVVDHHVKLGYEDQHADAREHSVHDGRRHGAKQPAAANHPRTELDQSTHQHDHTQVGETVREHQVDDDDGQASRGSGNLQRRSLDRADQEPTDDPGDQPESGRYAGRDGDAHAQGQSDQKHDQRRQQIAPLGADVALEVGEGHGRSPLVFTARAGRQEAPR